MNKKNAQKTLLHFWRSNSDLSSNKKNESQKINNNSNKNELINIIESNSNDILIDNDNENDDDVDDAKLIEATDKFLNETYNNQTHSAKINLNDDALTIGIDDNQLTCTQYVDINGFDKQSGEIWIYPTNFPLRDYQFNIVEKCLFKNTMVVLPTGMGKTFIAAVVMFNFYRWYPQGKVLFMAPTKPLVLQQADACCKIMSIPKDDISQMTGHVMPNQRKIQWASKRVFFLTPQVIMNDMLRGNIEIEQIKCVVIDEAHKALGDYAFCKVVESILERNKNFRVVALTATPGNDIKVSLNRLK